MSRDDVYVVTLPEKKNRTVAERLRLCDEPRRALYKELFTGNSAGAKAKKNFPQKGALEQIRFLDAVDIIQDETTALPKYAFVLSFITKNCRQFDYVTLSMVLSRFCKLGVIPTAVLVLLQKEGFDTLHGVLKKKCEVQSCIQICLNLAKAFSNKNLAPAILQEKAGKALKKPSQEEVGEILNKASIFLLQNFMFNETPFYELVEKIDQVANDHWSLEKEKDTQDESPQVLHEGDLATKLHEATGVNFWKEWLGDKDLRNKHSAQQTLSMRPQDVSSLLSAAAKGNYKRKEGPDPVEFLLLTLTERVVCSQWRGFGGQEISGCLWSLAKLDLAHPRFFTPIIPKLHREVFKPQEAVNILWSAVKSSTSTCSRVKAAEGSMEIEENFLRTAVQKTVEQATKQHLFNFNFQDLSNLIWCCGQVIKQEELRERSTSLKWLFQDFLPRAIDKVKKTLKHGNANEFSCILTSLQKLHTLHEDLVLDLCERFSALTYITPPTLTSLAYACARLCIGHAGVFRLIGKHASTIYEKCSSRQKADLLWSASVLAIVYGSTGREETELLILGGRNPTSGKTGLVPTRKDAVETIVEFIQATFSTLSKTDIKSFAEHSGELLANMILHLNAAGVLDNFAVPKSWMKKLKAQQAKQGERTMNSFEKSVYKSLKAIPDIEIQQEALVADLFSVDFLVNGKIIVEADGELHENFCLHSKTYFKTGSTALRDASTKNLNLSQHAIRCVEWFQLPDKEARNRFLQDLLASDLAPPPAKKRKKSKK